MISDFTLTRLQYVFGSLQMVITPFLVAYNVNLAKIDHLVKFMFLMPFRFRQFRKINWEYYMLEFCYWASLVFNLFLVQNMFLDGYFDDYFPAIYSFATGPILFAIFLNRDKLFIHSQSHLITTYIHLTPALMAWGLRWNNNDIDFANKFPVNFSLPGVRDTYLSLWSKYLVIYFPWMICYYFIVFVWKWDHILKNGKKNVFHDLSGNNKFILSPLANKVKSKYTKGLLYCFFHLFNLSITSFLSTLAFHNYYINTAFVVGGFVATTWFASYKYIKSIQEYDARKKAIPVLLAAKKKHFEAKQQEIKEEVGIEVKETSDDAKEKQD